MFAMFFDKAQRYKSFLGAPLSIILGGLVLITAYQPAAIAQNINSLSSDKIEEILNDAGFSPEMRTDSRTGAPVAVGQIGEHQFVMRALNCAGTPKSCKELMFFANFPLGRRFNIQDFVSVNKFNEAQVFGRAYLLRSSPQENGSVGVDYVIELDGGVSAEHVTNNVSRWGDVVAAFIEAMTSGEGNS